MQYVWDVEGRKYLDFFGGILTISVGHANPKITGPVKAQVNKLQHLSTLYFRTKPSFRWPARGADHARRAATSFFTNSGTEANEAADPHGAYGGNRLTTLWRFVTQYAGGSSLAKSVTAQAPWRKSGIISIGIAHAINPYCYRCRSLGLKYPDCEVACAKDVENPIQTGTSGQDRGIHRRTDSGSGRACSSRRLQNISRSCSRR